MTICSYCEAQGRTENRTLEVTEISKTLKNIAKNFEVPIVALSQINHKVEDRQNKRPQLADLRESGNIEQDADTFIYSTERTIIKLILIMN
ncbi:MAG: DnaB-like helicase C-terminal domain-containing protein [Wolbachia sp.]